MIRRRTSARAQIEIEESRSQPLVELISTYQQELFSFIWRQVRERELAEDLTQEVFVRAYRFMDQFEERSEVKHWLFRIAINVVRSYYESRAWKQRQRNVVLDESEVTGGRDTLREEVRHLLTLVRELPPDLREVVHLCVIEGYSYDEAARLLDIPTGTVASRIHRGLKLLRQKVLEGDS